MNLDNVLVENVGHLIPQKFPFVMVNDLLEFSETHLKSSFTITSSNLFTLDGVFREPGIIENMAQTVALHTGYSYFLKDEQPPTGYIGSIKKIEIKALPKVNTVITTTAEILHEFMGVTMVKVTMYNNAGEEIALGQMKTVIAPNGEN